MLSRIHRQHELDVVVKLGMYSARMLKFAIVMHFFWGESHSDDINNVTVMQVAINRFLASKLC